MTRITPRVFDELRVHGIATVVPAQRRLPVVVTAVLFDPRTAEVFLPPFDLENGLLVEVGDLIPSEEFDERVEYGQATPLAGPPARSDGCFFFPVGGAAGEYTSLTNAARRIAEFADDKAARGDALLRMGRPEDALAEYELAAACSQTPDHYARMLLVSLSPRRRKRILALLAQVSSLEEPMEHVHRLRAVLGRPKRPSTVPNARVRGDVRRRGVEYRPVSRKELGQNEAARAVLRRRPPRENPGEAA